MRAAIDLGTRSVAVLLYDAEGVRAAASALHSGRPVMDGVVLDIPEAAHALEAVLADLAARGFARPASAAIAVASREMTVRRGRAVLDVPGAIAAVDEARLVGEAVAEAAVALKGESEASASRPDTGAFLLVDRAVVSRRAGGAEVSSLVGQRGAAEVEVVATFVPRRVIEAKGEVLARLGIAVEGISLEPRAALAAAAPELAHRRLVAVVDIGAGTTDLALAEGAPDGAPRAVALDSMPVAGDEVTDRISVALGIPFAEAERRKKNGAPEVRAEIDAARTEHAGEIAARLDSLRAGAPLAEVLLVGNGSLLEGLSEAVARALAARGVSATVHRGEILRRKGFDPASVGAAGPGWATPAGILLLAAWGESLRLAPVTFEGETRILAIPPEGLGWPEVFAHFGRDLADLDGAPGRAIEVVVAADGSETTHLLPGARGAAFPLARFHGGESIAAPRPAAGADRAARLSDLPLPARRVQIRRDGGAAERLDLPFRCLRDGVPLASDAPIADGDRISLRPPRGADLVAALRARFAPAASLLVAGVRREIRAPLVVETADGREVDPEADLVEDAVFAMTARPARVADLAALPDLPARRAPGETLAFRWGGSARAWDEPLDRDAALVEAEWR